MDNGKLCHQNITLHNMHILQTHKISLPLESLLGVSLEALL